MLEDSRPPDEVAHWKSRDPITILGSRLEAMDYQDAATAEAAEKAVLEEIEASFEKCVATPFADESTALANVYEEPLEGHGDVRELELREAIREALVQEMRRDETVHLFGEDVAYYGGILGVTKGMLEEFGPDRVMDTPISESGFAGMAVGAALMGLRPVIEMQFTGLITVAMDQLVNTAAKARYVHDGAMSVPMVVRSPHMMHGNAYMSQALEAWFTHIPGFKVVTPSTPADAKGLMLTSIRDPDPVLYVEHEDLYGVTGPVPEGREGIPLGNASVLREGTDVTVVAWLAMVPVAEAGGLEARG